MTTPCKLVFSLAIISLAFSKALLAYSVYINVDQKSSYRIHFEAKDGKNGDTIFDLRPHAGEYFFEDASDHLDKITFNIKDETENTTINLASVLKDKFQSNSGYLIGFLGDDVLYELRREFTLWNWLYFDDTVYLRIVFTDLNEFVRFRETF